MALNPGFQNNINVIQIRTSGSSSQRLTDRPIDFDGDGVEEQVTLTPGTPAGGNTFNPPAEASAADNSLLRADNPGVARSVIKNTGETDLGDTKDYTNYEV